MTQNPPDPDFEAMLAAALGGTEHDAVPRAIEQTEPEPTPPGHRSGYVAVVGQPNVGKSTLVNQLLGEKIAIVSPKPQTTRLRQLGIYTRDDAQIIFVDTPGIHKPLNELGVFMVEVAKAALEDADVILFLTDISQPPNAADRHVVDYLTALNAPQKIIHILNKRDLVKNPETFKNHFEAHRALLPDADFVVMAAIDGDNVLPVLEKILARLPEGPRYYPKDQVSDIPLRDLAAEMIREQAMIHTEQEVPHSIAVEVNEFKRRSDKLIYIGATLYAERDGQKAIIIGKNGAMLKKISSAARKEIEAFVGCQVYLEIWVKVLPNWRRDEAALKRFGYKL